MATREMDTLFKNQDRIEKQTREDMRRLEASIKDSSDKQSRDIVRIFERLDDISQKQAEFHTEINDKFTTANHNQDLNIKELMVQAKASGKKSGIQAGASAGAGVAAGVATIIVFFAELINRLH